MSTYLVIPHGYRVFLSMQGPPYPFRLSIHSCFGAPYGKPPVLKSMIATISEVTKCASFR
uniref:Uncharacterized protein n=1 Tax=Arundo donax TaxID=35708 RepID=A0A0A9ALN6_ARUDO